MPGARAGEALPDRRGAGGRFAALAGRRADRGAAGGPGGAVLAVVPEEPGGGGVGGGGVRGFGRGGGDSVDALGPALQQGARRHGGRDQGERLFRGGQGSAAAV